MDFNAKQMKEDALIKEGRYKFSVLDAREKRASSGNDMIKLKLSLEVGGRRVVFWCNLILLPKMFWMIEHFCDTTGMMEKIDEGRLMAQDCFDREGYVDIIQKINGETGEVENAVKDFVKRSETEDQAAPVSAPDFDDEIPL